MSVGGRGRELAQAINWPLAIRLPLGSVVKEYTRPFMPEPNGDQEDPSQRAMNFAAVPPADKNEPPATRSPLASVVRAPTRLFTPAPIGNQEEPFQRAM